MGHLSNLKNPRTLLRTQSFNFSTTVSKNGGLQRSVSLAKPNNRNGSERSFWKRKKSVKDRCTCGNLLFKNEFLQPSRSRYVCVKKCMNLVSEICCTTHCTVCNVLLHCIVPHHL